MSNLSDVHCRSVITPPGSAADRLFGLEQSTTGCCSSAHILSWYSHTIFQLMGGSVIVRTVWDDSQLKLQAWRFRPFQVYHFAHLIMFYSCCINWQVQRKRRCPATLPPSDTEVMVVVVVVGGLLIGACFETLLTFIGLCSGWDQTSLYVPLWCNWLHSWV